MESHEVRRLVIDRRRECGIGLCGSYEAIARWLLREHNVIASTSWIEQVIREDREADELAAQHMVAVDPPGLDDHWLPHWYRPEER